MEFTNALTLSSKVRYAAWKIRGKNGSVNLHFHDGPTLVMRDENYGVAYEVFVHKYYGLHDGSKPEDIRTIVDLGGNVGYSVLWFLSRFPNASILVYEPNPVFCSRLRENVALNGFDSRVTVREAAVSNANGSLPLFVSGACSSLLQNYNTGHSVMVPVVDVFEQFPKGRIDILKMDIEGSEYGILSDPRFRTLDINRIVIEWHKTKDPTEGKERCRMELSDAGYNVREIMDGDDHGMCWALRTRQ